MHRVAHQHTLPMGSKSVKSSELRSKSTLGLASTLSATPFVLLRLFCLHLGFRLLPRRSFGLSLGLSSRLIFLRLRNEGPQRKSKAYLVLEIVTHKAVANLATLKLRNAPGPGFQRQRRSSPQTFPAAETRWQGWEIDNTDLKKSDFSNSSIC